MSEFRFTANDEADTERLGAALASALRRGDVIALHGQLGAGKTRFVQAMAGALGCEDQWINSPTFVLIQEYDGRLPVYHIDAYRLKDCDEFLEIGGEEILAGEGVCLIEWAEKVGDVLPGDHVAVSISVTGERSRCFQIRSTGARSRELVDAVRSVLNAG